MIRSCLMSIAAMSILLMWIPDLICSKPVLGQDDTSRQKSTEAKIVSQKNGDSVGMADVLRRAEASLIAKDAEGLVSLYAEDFLFEDTAFGLRITDKTELRSYFDRLFSSPDVSFSDANYFGLDGRAAGKWTWSGRSKQSGDRFSIRGASLFKIEENKIVEEIIFYDPRAAGY